MIFNCNNDKNANGTLKGPAISAITDYQMMHWEEHLMCLNLISVKCPVTRKFRSD